MSKSQRLLLQLNRTTRRWHGQVDEPWLALLRPHTSEHEYRDQLVRMYGFEAPLEGACAYTPQLSRTVEHRHLRRAGLIAHDLLALGLTPAEVAAIPQCGSITPFKDIPEALGWLYVVERSTLHHPQVRRHLQQRIAGFGHASHYLGMFDATPDHWERFGDTLERVADRPEVAEQVVDAAHAGFERMHEWFRSTAPRLRSTA